METKKPNLATPSTPRRSPTANVPRRPIPVLKRPATAARPQAKPSKNWLKYVHLSRKTILIISAVMMGVLAIAALSTLVGRKDSDKNPSASQNNVAPDFQAVLPGSKDIAKLGGWQRVSPPDSEPVYAFADRIDDVSISVSQQRLPEQSGSNPSSQVADIAHKFNATTKLDSDGTAVYIGTSAKGPQSVILTKNNLLILIKSQQKIDDKSWVEYVKTLWLPSSLQPLESQKF